MSVAVWGMIGAGVVALVVGLVMVRGRFAVARGVGKLLVLGPVFEAVALAVFAAEHFFFAREMTAIVPKWLPGALFWTYFFGVALALAAVSLVVGRGVKWASVLLAAFFLIIVVTVDLPGLGKHLHDRFFWILTVRETCFAGGVMVLAGSLWPGGGMARGLMVVGRWIVAGTFLFYAAEHFLHPRNVPGVPLEKMIPEWMPGPVVLSYFVGVVLLVCGVGLMLRRSARVAAGVSGGVLVVLTALFYLPILVMEVRSPLAIEGINYVGDTLLFAATALLAGFGAEG